ncbi:MULTISPECIES: HAD family hydrolase [unclassified Streptomyces]|uniref:HAD family hydrolase n=1 Tax=unclassified Streptomyces TaxID=2593676 RepID=UPI001BE7FD4B|nr:MULTISPECIES: HAD-IA family hydrolase [unclassified Streptomyces]MBT2408592.1 HAD-IA family hydrolase [Streptomyces sp. ISL-21]MBT2608724.1 HAD-IA family hydrolase [Streptomyces sp. ISL-87]
MTTETTSLRKLVIFDLDGTLIDSRRVMTSSFRLAYAQTVGPGEAPVGEFLKRLGQPFPDILNELGLPGEMYEVFRQLSSARVADVVTIPEAIEACHRLRAIGVDSAVITGKDRRRTEEILAHLAIGDLFSGLVAGDDDMPGKPAPDGVLALCERQGVAPGQTVVVGDSWVDIAAGFAAGARTVACGWGMGTKAELRGAQPDVYIAHPTELFGCLHGMLAQRNVPTTSDFAS